jgi:nitrate reductase delta subunit
MLRYPRAGWIGWLSRSREALRAMDSPAAAPLDSFAEQVQGLSLEQLQELYTATFDLNPICALEVGWQLFGEEYARGSFLVAMRAKLREQRIAEEGELPDHLAGLLTLLDQLAPQEARELASSFLAPAVAKMLAGFPGKANPYENLLRAVNVLLPAAEEVAHG